MKILECRGISAGASEKLLEGTRYILRGVGVCMVIW